MALRRALDGARRVSGARNRHREAADQDRRGVSWPGVRHQLSLLAPHARSAVLASSLYARSPQRARSSTGGSPTHRRKRSTGRKTSACRRSPTTITASACKTPAGRGSRARRRRRWARSVAIPMSTGGCLALSLLVAVVLAWLRAGAQA